MLKISWTVKVTNERVLTMANIKHKLLESVKKRKMTVLGHKKKYYLQKLNREFIANWKNRRQKSERQTENDIHIGPTRKIEMKLFKHARREKHGNA